MKLERKLKNEKRKGTKKRTHLYETEMLKRQLPKKEPEPKRKE